jgi:Zn-dependent M28 family amino/carboxypeptidase
MFRSTALLLTACAFVAAPATAQTFSPERIRADVSYLADDLLEGRNAGTRGYDIAAKFVASRFEALGLKPGAAGNSYFQAVPFVEVGLKDAAKAAFTIDGQRFVNGVDSVIGASPIYPSQSEEVEVVFVGYGLEDKRFGLDDYAGLDVKGKVVATIYGAPSNVPSEEAASLQEGRGKLAASKGAVGMIRLFTPALEKLVSWERLAGYGAERSLRWVEPNGQPHIENPTLRIGGTLSKKASAALLQGASTDWPTLLKSIEDKAAKPKGFAVPRKLRFERQSEINKVNSSNVIGLIEGSDPSLATEVVMLTGHLDHDGIVKPEKGDSIKNGAMDNAAGIATMLEAARAFQESGKRPRRSVMFVALTAEEDGLLGSDYLAHNPVPGRKVIANVNLDMPILTYDFTDVIAFGAEHSTMGPIVARAVQAMGVKLSPDPIPEEGLFTRSDHYSFVKKGVPAVFLATGYAGEGKEKSQDFLKNHYHQVSDEVDLPFRWDAGAKFAKVNYLIARELADGAEAPRWYEGSFFGDKFAAGQPKAKKP